MQLLHVLIIVVLLQCLNTFSNASRRDIIENITSISSNKRKNTPDKIKETRNQEVVSSITKKTVSSHSLKIVTFGAKILRSKIQIFCSEELNFYSYSHHQLILHIVKEVFGSKCEQVPLDYYSELASNALSMGKFDIFIEPLYIGLSHASNYSILYPHDTDDLCFLVAEVPPREVSLLLTVPSFVWLIIAASILAFFAAAAVGYGLHLPLASFDVVSTLITGAFDDRLRRLMIWLSLLSFFLWNFIGGSLTGSFVNPGHGRVLDSLEKIDAVLTHIINGHTSTSEYVKFLETADDVYVSLVRKLVADGSGGHLKEDEAYLLPQSGIYLIRFFYYERLHQKLVRADACMFSPCYVSFPVRYNWVCDQRFNELLQRTIETGLYQIVKKEFCRKNLFRRGLSRVCNPFPKPLEKVETLKFKFFKGSFILFGFGTSCAFLSFLAENKHRIRHLRWHVLKAKALLVLVFRKMCNNHWVSARRDFQTFENRCRNRNGKGMQHFNVPQR